MSLFGGFYSYGQVFAAALALDSYLPASDVCFVDDEDDGFIPSIEGVENDFVTLTAGDALTVTSPAGTYASLALFSAFGISGYTTDSELTGPAPSGLTIDIPGAQFPAFTNVPIPDVTILNGVSPSVDSNVTATTTFTWTAGSNPDSRILIDAGDLSCIALDDGNFSIPAATQAELGSGFNELSYDIQRLAIAFRQSGNALLLVISTADS